MNDHRSEPVDRRATEESHDREESTDGVRHPGPTDSGNAGGMATREIAPEVAADGEATHGG